MMKMDRRVIRVIRNKILPKQLRNREKTDKRRKRRSVTRRRRIRRKVQRLSLKLKLKKQPTPKTPNKRLMRNLPSSTASLSKIRRNLRTRASATSMGPSPSLKWIASTLTIRRN
jgi:hypothetical protein